MAYTTSEIYDYANQTYWVEDGVALTINVFMGARTVASASSGPTTISQGSLFYNRGTLQTTSGSSFYYAYTITGAGTGKSAGTTVYGADYNAIQVKAGGILGSGSYYGGPTNGYGYGQTVSSSLVTPTNRITAQQWNNLAADINSIWTHQSGASFPSYTALVASQDSSHSISVSNLDQMSVLAEHVVADRSAIAPNQLTVTSAIASDPITTPFGYTPGTRSSITSIKNIAIGSSFADINYFFNSGGWISVYGVRDGSATGLSDQENAWYSLIGGWGSTLIERVALDAMITAGVGTFVTLYTASSTTSPYTGATVTLSSKIVSGGSGNVIQIQVTFDDAHAPTGNGPDTVRAGLVGYSIDKRTYSGAFSSPGIVFTSIQDFS
jgi:hypothetical protein